MPRNRSEKEPALEGVHQSIIDVLIADAGGNHRDGVPVAGVRDGSVRWTHHDGNPVHARLDVEVLRTWARMAETVRRTFVADYMEYLYATQSK